MRSNTLFTAALGTTFVAARAKVGLLAPHIVQNIRRNASPATPILAEGDAGIVAFYATGDCKGTPAYLHMRDQTCYGPIARAASINLVIASDHCEVLVRHHPCGIDQLYTILNGQETSCIPGGSVEEDLDVWVQCNLPPVPPNGPPAPPPEQSTPPEQTIPLESQPPEQTPSPYQVPPKQAPPLERPSPEQGPPQGDDQSPQPW